MEERETLVAVTHTHTHKFFYKIEQLYKKYIKVFIAIMAIGLFAHMLAITNKFLNHDELSCLFSKGASYSLGRWGLEVISFILPNISMPWYNGLITLILISISSCMIFELFEVKNRIFQVIIGGIMITFPSITATLTYMFTASSYAVAIFLSVLSVYIVSKKNIKLDIIGIICLVFSLSLYQAYISLATTLFIILLIKDAAKNEIKFKTILITAIRYFIFLIISLGTYLVLTKIINKYKDLTFSSYQGADTMGKVTIHTILFGIIRSYGAVYKIAFSNWNGLTYNKILKLIYIIIYLIDGITILLYINNIRKKSIINSIFTLVLFAMLPITMNMLFILNAEVSMHQLMIYGNIIVLTLPMLLYDNIKEIKFSEYIKNISVIFLTVIIFQYITLANECYTKMYLAYENTYAFYSTLITKIQSHEDYKEGVRIALIGEYSGKQLNNYDGFFKDTIQVTGVKKPEDLINAYSNTNFIRNYIGVNFDFVSEGEIKELMKKEEYREMAEYPYTNSIKLIDNILVVKY